VPGADQLPLRFSRKDTFANCTKDNCAITYRSGYILILIALTLVKTQ
jgi:hypothetical protein